MIIGIAGKKGSGKSAAAGFLPKSFVRTPFASTLKHMIHVMLFELGMSTTELDFYANDGKEAEIDGLGVSYRHLCQTLGTEWGRDLVRNDLWCLVMRKRIERLGSENIVIDDVRFETEAKLVRDLGGVIVHISRPCRRSTDEHASENGLIIQADDVCLVNDGDMDDLQRKFLDALADKGFVGLVQ